MGGDPLFMRYDVAHQELAIFVKRIHAMYEGSRNILLLMIFFEATLVLAQTILSVLISSATHCKYLISSISAADSDVCPVSPASGTTGCVPGHWVLRPWVYWIPATVLENILFLLVAVKSVRCAVGMEQYNPDLLMVLLRDSVVYFGGLCTILTANIIIWTVGRVSIGSLL